MLEPVAAVSLVWLAGLVAFEIVRPKAAYPFDFLSMANLLFALNFALPPVGHAVSPAYAEQVGRFLHYEGFDPLSTNAMVTTGIAVASHALISIVYTVSRHRVLAASFIDGAFSRLSARIGDRRYFWASIGLGVLGLAAFAAYVASLGGVQRTFRLSQPLSAGEVTATYGFLKIFAMLLVPAFYVALSRACEPSAGHRWVWAAVSAAFGATALGLLVHDLGRLQIAMFLFIPIVALAIVRGRGFFLWLPLLAVAGWALLAVFRPLYFYITRGAEKYLSEAIQSIVAPFNNISIALSATLSEFAFPYFVLDRYLSVVPDQIEYRGIADFVAAVVLLLPSVWVGADPEYILDLNVLLFQMPLPIDLISLGYVSFGFLGIVLFSMGYGFALAAFEAVFGHSRGWVSAVFRAAWLFYVPWWLMYGDPMNAFKRGFGLIVATVLLLVLSADRAPLFRRRRRRAGMPGDNDHGGAVDAGR